jgi:beta-xylosidase
MIEAAMLWNEPNNKSHWDFIEVDPEWRLFSQMAIAASQAIGAERPGLPRVLGGISPIDPLFIDRMSAQGVLSAVDVVAVHGFPLDWNLWNINEWPAQIASIRERTSHPVWVSEVGVSTFGADEVQEFGVLRTAQLLRGLVPRIHWYSLFDLPRAWPATTRHREAEGSSYYRHFHMGLVREDGTPKPAYEVFATAASGMGICQWFHFEDPRLDEAVVRLRELGVRYIRTGLSWADSLRPGADRWFDRLMRALDEFETTVTFCFTPESLGVQPHHTSAPRDLDRFAHFCAQMIRRYAPASAYARIAGSGDPPIHSPTPIDRPAARAAAPMSEA